MNKKEGSFPIIFLLKTLVFQYILTGVLLAILAFVLLKTGLGEKAVSIAVIAIYIVATVFGGWMSGRKMENRRFLWGLLMGGGYFLVLALVSLMAGGDISGGNTFVTTLILCAGGGMLGGMLS